MSDLTLASLKIKRAKVSNQEPTPFLFGTLRVLRTPFSLFSQEKAVVLILSNINLSFDLVKQKAYSFLNTLLSFFSLFSSVFNINLIGKEMIKITEKTRAELKNIYVESKRKHLSDSDVSFYLYLVKYCDSQKKQKVRIHLPFHAVELKCLKQQIYRKLNLLAEIQAIKKDNENGSALYIEILSPEELLALHGIDHKKSRIVKSKATTPVHSKDNSFNKEDFQALWNKISSTISSRNNDLILENEIDALSRMMESIKSISFKGISL